uniref:Uncharacterized protein n=1 Tax=Nelumbo nucifera TaxID=4432 RepID=A0A822ZPM4_NELNU|nr:TPA_asm: hypothetical protein HUJ06_016367 [Nelumbo nucifera]
MKEMSLIPNAVAMLDGLCKDGLVQEAMKLFGLMHEKGTFLEVVIYTKLDDAKRIFRKMQNNGISPNVYSYTVFIQGLYKGKRLEDAIDICIEMLEAGHSPNVTTFIGLVDAICRDKGVEEAKSTIERLEKGYFADEKAIREYLDKKGTFSPLIWEVVFEKKRKPKFIDEKKTKIFCSPLTGPVRTIVGREKQWTCKNDYINYTPNSVGWLLLTVERHRWICNQTLPLPVVVGF